MRLDAARLKGCFGSCFRQKLLPEVQGVLPPRASEELRLSAGFFVSGVHSTAPWIQDLALDPENVEFFSPLSRSAARSPHSPDLRSRRADRPEGADRAGATGGFGGVAP